MKRGLLENIAIKSEAITYIRYPEGYLNWQERIKSLKVPTEIPEDPFSDIDKYIQLSISNF